MQRDVAAGEPVEGPPAAAVHAVGGLLMADVATLADGVADRTKAASAELLDKHPLYPGLELS